MGLDIFFSLFIFICLAAHSINHCCLKAFFSILLLLSGNRDYASRSPYRHRQHQVILFSFLLSQLQSSFILSSVAFRDFALFIWFWRFDRITYLPLYCCGFLPSAWLMLDAHALHYVVFSYFLLWEIIRTNDVLVIANDPLFFVLVSL